MWPSWLSVWTASSSFSPAGSWCGGCGESRRDWRKRPRRGGHRNYWGSASFCWPHILPFTPVANLVGWLPEPQPSLVGVGIVVASAVVMSGLYVGKMRIATRMQSRSLRAEAMETLFCDIQDLTILVGLGFNALFSWWWADPVSAWILIPFLIKEGMENFSGHDDEHEDHAPRVCFCPSCFYGVRRCRAVCCEA